MTVLPRLAPLLLLAGCAATSHPARSVVLGTPSSGAALEALLDRPGPLTVETVHSSSWAVPLSGLLDLGDPRARQAGLADREEPIEVDFHVLRHPTRGTFLVDTGVERALKREPERAAVSGLVARVMHVERMGLERPLGDWLEATGTRPDGVFFTHLHLDHVSGAPDLPPGTPLYAGPGEASGTAFLHLFTRGAIDRALAGQAPLSELRFEADPSGRFAGVLDVFGDGSLFALWVPGHTPGSLAYLARTPEGPVLLVGDTCHTAWGWEHQVVPGSYTEDHAANATSLARLKALADAHPGLQVRLGHQRLPAVGAVSSP